jgi:hypothetical protein
MREIRTSGSVRGGDGNVPAYSAAGGQRAWQREGSRRAADRQRMAAAWQRLRSKMATGRGQAGVGSAR